jgi:hypothetical protein
VLIKDKKVALTIMIFPTFPPCSFVSSLFFGKEKSGPPLFWEMVKDNAAGLTKGEATRQGEAPRLASQS